MIRVAIVGGGISGLSAAFYLDKAKRAGAQVEYTVFEAANRLGGVIQTERHNDFVIEAGPDSFLTAKPWAAELARELGIADQLMGSNDSTRKTYILLDGRLVPMPDGLQMIVPTKLWPMASSPLFSISTKIRMLREYLLPPRALAEGQDESVGSFVNRHFGNEVTDNLASPLLAGVYGGDANRLSARAVLPRFVEMEKQHGSLVRGVLSAMKNGAGGNAGPLFTTFRDGMQGLVDAVCRRLDSGSVRTGVTVQQVEQVGRGWRVTVEGEKAEAFDHIIVATPAYAAAKLLRRLDAQLADKLDEIPYAAAVTVAVAYVEKELEATGANILPGFGFLVPHNQNIPIIACTFVHNKFAHRVPEGGVLLRLFLNDAIDWPEERIRAAVAEQLAGILRITAQPTNMQVFRWPRSMAQYEVGHLERVSAIERLAARHQRIELIGNAYRGIGTPDCIREGKEAAERVVHYVESQKQNP